MMRIILIIFSMSLLGSISSAQMDSGSRGLRALKRCLNTCDRSCRYVVQDAQSLIEDVVQECGFDRRRGPRGPRRASVEFFSSDSCGSGLITAISPKTNCEELASRVRGNVWGIKIDGQCFNVSDTNVKSACYAYKGAAFGGTKLYASDSCGSGLVAVVDEHTNCNDFSGKVSGNVWGVSINGQCYNIADTNVNQACHAFANGSGEDGVQLFASDSCSSGMVATVDWKTDCDRAAANIRGNVWGIKVRGGSCQNISDTNFREACFRYKDL